MLVNAISGAQLNALGVLHKDAGGKSRYNSIDYNMVVGLVSPGFAL